MNKVLAIVGMCGVGKSVVCDYLTTLGYNRLYFGGITYKLMEEEGIVRTPDSERLFRENLRKVHGDACYAKFLYPEIEKMLQENKLVVLDGLYSWHELTFLQDKLQDKLVVISVVCDKDLRYDRISKRKDRPFDNEKAKERDISEIENLFKGGPISYADYYILNNGTFDDVYKRVDEILTTINK